MTNNNHNDQPITEKSLWKILGDFFEQITVPYMDKRFEEVDERFKGVEKKLEEHDQRFDRLDDRLEKIDERLDRHGKQLEDHEEKINQIRHAFA